MQSKQKVLLITHRPHQLYDRILEANGFSVDLAGSIETAEQIWQPGKYRLLLVEANGNLAEALDFCSRTKKSDPEQRFAFMTQRNLDIPKNACPDDVIMLECNPELFVERVSELVS